jgi:hypothetical protein
MADAFKKTNLLSLLFVLAILPVSGCIGGGNQTAIGQGLVIEKFLPTLDTAIESGEPVGLQLEVRNRGDYNGLMGSGAPAVAEIMAIDPTEWIVTPSTVVDLGSLLAPDVESQTEGGLGKVTWELTAPTLQRGERKLYPVRARVYYLYETKAIKPVWFVTSEELRRLVQSGESLTSEVVSQTAGPLTVTVNAGPFVKARELTDARFQLQIRIDNTGGGQIRGRNYPVAISVEWPTWVSPVGGYCPTQTQWGTPLYTDVPTLLPQPTGTFVYIWDGRTTDVTCEFQIMQPPSSRTQGNFKVNLNYLYSVDASTQITVKGMEEF